MKTSFLKTLLVGLSVFIFQGVSMAETPSAPPIYYVIFHHPGPRWEPGVDFRKQPGVMEHVGYFSKVFDAGKLKLGGPFLDNSGGMAVVAASSIEEATSIAEDDPSVKNGLLTVDVKPWMVPFLKE